MKILLAIDDSQYSADAVETVAAQPWPPGTAVRVLSAVENIVVPAAELWYDARGDFESARQELTKRAEQLTARVAERLTAKGLAVDTAVRQGDPRSAIVDEAKEWSADLIVVGSHGRTGIERWLLGSVAQSVVSHAPCSVEVVRRKPTEVEDQPSS
jgi:nucleotide-binding universal stress UspA family protein